MLIANPQALSPFEVLHTRRDSPAADRYFLTSMMTDKACRLGARLVAAKLPGCFASVSVHEISDESYHELESEDEFAPGFADAGLQSMETRCPSCF